jgi:Ni,Fe-hydrogenase III large subunit
VTLRNGDLVALGDLDATDGVVFHGRVVDACSRGGRLGALSFLPQAGMLVAIVLHDEDGALEPFAARISKGGTYPSLTKSLPEAQALERAVLEDHGIVPEGHPWPKPLRRHAALDPASGGLAHEFFQVTGAGVHEVAVGPVHAGIIEPGHFRFQCSGETVHTLEIHLGYQHRGALDLLIQAPPARRLAIAESIAGDTAIGHALAHCQAVESLAGVEPPLLAHVARGVALELERIANHVGDLGALCSDVGYLPGASWFGRLRGEMLNLLLELSGNRLGKGLVVPGGVRFAPDAQSRAAIVDRLSRAERELRAVAAVTFDTPSVVSRFERTGTISRVDAAALGLVGPAARASGVARDVRQNHPYGIYRFSHIPIASIGTGDVMARVLERWIEVERSLTFVRERLGEMADGPLSVPLRAMQPNRLAVGMVEGWRGEIVHLLATDGEGRIVSADVVDPSLHNWLGLAFALRGNQISDFPLCNKSFNLSYAGHDL